MEEMTTQSFSKHISLLRIVATIAVVFLHTNSTLTDNRELFQLTENQFLFHLCAYRMLYWAVPVFLMITGALLLKKDKTISYDICIKKYCKRILLALFIFGVPFSIMMIFMEIKQVSPLMILQAVMNVIKGESFGHLWYLYVLIGIYLVLPAIKSATDNMEKKAIETFLSVLFLFNFCIPVIERLADIDIAFMVPLTTFSIFYIVCGHYLEEYAEVDRKIVIAGFVGTLVAAIIVALISGSGDYLGYDSPIICLAGIFSFLLFKGTDIKNVRKEWIWNVDRLCFGVYLIHPVFIHFTYRLLKITPVSFDLYWLAMPAFGVIFVVVTFFGSWVMSRIKPLKKYVL